MNVKIVYQKSKDKNVPCLATTEVGGEYHCGAGVTWEEAKANLISRVEAYLSIELPPPETVSIGQPESEELFPWEEEEVNIVTGEAI